MRKRDAPYRNLSTSIACCDPKYCQLTQKINSLSLALHYHPCLVHIIYVVVLKEKVTRNISQKNLHLQPALVATHHLGSHYTKRENIAEFRHQARNQLLPSLGRNAASYRLRGCLLFTIPQPHGALHHNFLRSRMQALGKMGWIFDELQTAESKNLQRVLCRLGYRQLGGKFGWENE